MKVALSFITIGEGKKCLVYKKYLVLKSTMLPISHFAINVKSYEWNHTISFKNGDNYLLCNGCVKFFKNIKNKEMAGIKDIEKVR